SPMASTALRWGHRASSTTRPTPARAITAFTCDEASILLGADDAPGPPNRLRGDPLDACAAGRRACNDSDRALGQRDGDALVPGNGPAVRKRASEDQPRRPRPL